MMSALKDPKYVVLPLVEAGCSALPPLDVALAYRLGIDFPLCPRVYNALCRVFPDLHKFVLAIARASERLGPAHPGLVGLSGPTVKDLLQVGAAGLLRAKGFGPWALLDIQFALWNIGLRLVDQNPKRQKALDERISQERARRGTNAPELPADAPPPPVASAQTAQPIVIKFIHCTFTGNATADSIAEALQSAIRRAQGLGAKF